MCGLAGIVGTVTPEYAREQVRKMVSQLVHRGPDGEGLEVVPPRHRGHDTLVFGHRRLAILDRGAGGHQPTWSPDRRHLLIFNGEIYNYRSLRKRLTTLGHVFRSTGDTEVLIHTLAEWGIEGVGNLSGMFALAWHDLVSDTTWLIRDPLGIKPLYYVHLDGAVAFASEIPPLLALPGVARTGNPSRLFDFLAHGRTDHGAETMFLGVHQVPGGHALCLRPGEDPQLLRWTDSGNQRARATTCPPAETLRALLLDTVSRHLQADVPIGVALSGGIDSGAVAVAAHRLLPRDTRFRAFTFLNADPAITEAPGCTLNAAAAGAVVETFDLSPDALLDQLPATLAIQAEPFADPVVIAQRELFTRARAAGVTVVLTGEGADEVFAGYPWFLPARTAGCIRSGHWIQALRDLRRRTPATSCLPETARLSLPLAASRALRRLQGPVTHRLPYCRWIDAAFFQDRGVTPEPPWHPRRRPVLQGRLAHARQTHYLPALLRYQDRNAMHASTENRVPFLAPEMVAFAESLADRKLIAPDGTGKAVLRAALAGLVPPAVLARPVKTGFAVPAAAWMRQLRPRIEARLGPAIRTLPGVIPDCLPPLLGGLTSGAPWAVRVAWRLLCVDEWCRQFDVGFDQGVPPPGQRSTFAVHPRPSPLREAS